MLLPCLTFISLCLKDSLKWKQHFSRLRQQQEAEVTHIFLCYCLGGGICWAVLKTEMKIVCWLRCCCSRSRILNCNFFGGFVLLLLMLCFISLFHFCCGSLLCQRSKGLFLQCSQCCCFGHNWNDRDTPLSFQACICPLLWSRFFSHCVLFCMIWMTSNCSALGVCIADKLLIYMSWRDAGVHFILDWHDGKWKP